MKSRPKTSLPLFRLTLVFLGAASLMPAPSVLHAQPAGGRGVAAQAGVPLSVAQQLALNREMTIPDNLTAAQAAAANALTAASLAVPANAAGIEAGARTLAEAELNVALARAAAFERVQASLRPLTPEQASTYARGGGRGGGRGGATSNWETVFNDNTGFTQLFDGRTLNGWEGEAGKFDVQDGAIHRHQTLEPRNFVDFGQYHLHYREVFSDFHLKVEFKVRGGNAGIQYRSRLESALRARDGEPPRESPNNIPLRNVNAAIADPLGKPLPANIRTLDDALNAGLLPQGIPYGNGTGHPWQVSGYQFDITGAGTGNWYEGQGRGTVGSVGDIMILQPGNVRTVIGKVADLPWTQWGRDGDWNKVEIIARGNTVMHMLNGRVVFIGIDDDPDRRAMKGIISLQLEGPQDCEVWYRNIWIKKL